MKKYVFKSIFASVFILAASNAFAEHHVEYISPNNDGIKDVLEVPLKIREKRYVKEWSFTVFDESGNVVRTIGNKIALPSKFNLKIFFKALFTPKRGVDIPSKIVWNGFLDDGSLAPDGKYFYQFTASDDNGNTASSSKLEVIVDNTPPQINLVKLSGDDKVFGEGSKPTLTIAQSGSSEVLWTASISDKKKNVIRSYEWNDAAPVDIVWNGTDGNSMIVPDGLYDYEISATDLAGNKSEPASIANILFSAEKPEIAVSINGLRYFAPSPRGKTVSDNRTVSFDVAIPAPSASVNSLTDWSICVLAKDSDKVIFEKSGKTNPPSSFVYDGKSNDGSYIADGEYRTRVTARYLNGYEPAPVYSPSFVVDNEAPSATVSLPSNTTFNGNSKFVIGQKGLSEPAYTGEKKWCGKIVDYEGKVVKEYPFDSELPESIEWDGLTEDGQFVPDGKYKYVLSVSELAGNFNEIASKEFALDTSKTDVALSVSPQAFSLNPANPSKTVTFTPFVKAASGIASYNLAVKNFNGDVVKSFSGTGAVPSSFVWDGLTDDGVRCEDGPFTAVLDTVAISGTKSNPASVSVILDSAAPVISLSTEYLDFSPDGVSKRQNLPVKATESSEEAKWTCEIKNEGGAVVRTLNWVNSKVTDFAWDGNDDAGVSAPNGKYSLCVSSKDVAGNVGEAYVKDIVLDNRVPSGYVSAEYKGISPNGDDFLDSQKFDIRVSLKEGISFWKFDIAGADGVVAKTFSSSEQKELPSEVKWAGDKNDGTGAEGIFMGKLHVEYEKGNVLDAQSELFLCTSKLPEPSVKMDQKYFSPDNDGNDDDLFLHLRCNTLAGLKNWSFVIFDRNGQPFWQTSGKSSITEKIVWDGRGSNGELVQSAEDYSYQFFVADELGMSNSVNGIISVDVLVVRDGDKLKMQIPSIIFRSDAADFVVKSGNKPGITQAQADNNERVLKRVAQILKKFSAYKVTIVGHANRTSDNESEETVAGSWGAALIPLSEQRAEFVKKILTKKGISAGRLSTEGKGGTEPIADRKDKAVNWKNRRVEFILEK